jgi:hypothetical protein
LAITRVAIPEHLLMLNLVTNAQENHGQPLFFSFPRIKRQALYDLFECKKATVVSKSLGIFIDHHRHVQGYSACKYFLFALKLRQTRHM